MCVNETFKELLLCKQKTRRLCGLYHPPPAFGSGDSGTSCEPRDGCRIGTRGGLSYPLHGELAGMSGRFGSQNSWASQNGIVILFHSKVCKKSEASEGCH